ncbi:MAG TPA: hypothetical protein VM686_06975 [Polyangiaceae bacterium]|nr:hypothetical protein [Polyangiaceae bacterium]
MLRFLSSAACSAAAFLVVASARAEELSPTAEALLVDVERIVDAEESSGWFLDEQAQESIHGTVLASVCRVPSQTRKQALGELERRHRELGDARQLFENAGRVMTSEVEAALFVERQLTALTFAVERADTDCPFWVEVDPDFQGRHTDLDRFTLSLESGGSAQLRETEGSWTLGGGGLMRILAGYGLSRRVTMLGGIEFGGGAMLKPHTEPTQFVINYFPALPLVFRLRNLAWHYDFESAPVALFQADNGAFSWGVRGAFGLGVSALRTRGFLPWAGATIAYEYYLPSGGRDAQHFIRGGLRVGFMWDP